jgi:hypothetical protein
MKLLILMFSTVFACACPGAVTNVVFFDDFEAPSLRSPPSNWAMWGAEGFKTPAKCTLRPELETAIRELRLPMTRFYAVGDEPFGVESSIDKAAEVCRRVGVAQDHCVLEFEEQGAIRALPPGT